MNTPEDITGPINLGNPGEFTILELAEKIIAETGSQSQIIHEELPLDDPRQRRPQIELAQKTLQWQPTVDLATGLKSTIAYFKAFLNENAG
jgi:UDP-glucuronate decarboxylase